MENYRTLIQEIKDRLSVLERFLSEVGAGAGWPSPCAEQSPQAALPRDRLADDDLPTTIYAYLVNDDGDILESLDMPSESNPNLQT